MTKPAKAVVVVVCSAGGNPQGKFALGLVQNEWKVYVKRPLDREEQDTYLLNITATDGLFVTQTAVEVIVTDVNDNSPLCDQVCWPDLFVCSLFAISISCLSIGILKVVNEIPVAQSRSC